MAIAPQEVLSLIVAGGRSSRFGQDKASYRWGGETLLERAVRTVSSVSGETALGLPPEQEGEPEVWKRARGAHRVIIDEPVGIGPIGSLIAGLRAAEAALKNPEFRIGGPNQVHQSPSRIAAVPDWLLFLAVDLPLMESAQLQRLLDEASSDVQAVVATRQDRIEPTCALYHTTLVPNVEQAIQSGEFALRSLFRKMPYARVPLPARALTNVNRLEDLPHPD